MMDPRFKKERLVVFLRKYPFGLGCLFVFVGLGVYWCFNFENLPAAEMELESKTSEARRLASNIKNAVRLREHVETMSEAVAKIDDRLVRASDLATNLGYFYQLVKDTGVKLVDVKQNALPVSKDKDRKPAGSYLAVPFTVIVAGDYPHLVSFLRSLENGRYFCRVNNAIIDTSRQTAPGADASEEAGDLRLTISLDLEGVL